MLALITGAIFEKGDILATTSTKSPAERFGGTWEKLPNGLTFWTANNGGSIIEAGLPNITGRFNMRQGYYSETYKNYGLAERGKSGAFNVVAESSGDQDSLQILGQRQPWDNITFDASQSNDIYGKSTTVQPPAYTICAWRKIS